MTCSVCQQSVPVAQLQTCWCKTELCPSCMAAHLPGCETAKQPPVQQQPERPVIEQPKWGGAGFTSVGRLMGKWGKWGK